ncbi:MAG: hypothetical protein AAF675_18990, partial [Pseudomonadota bacterium]
TPVLQARIDGLEPGAVFRLKDLLEAEWPGVDNKAGLEAIFARYVDRGGRFERLESLPGNIPGSRLFRRIV